MACRDPPYVEYNLCGLTYNIILYAQKTQSAYFPNNIITKYLWQKSISRGMAKIFLYGAPAILQNIPFLL